MYLHNGTNCSNGTDTALARSTERILVIKCDATTIKHNEQFSQRVSIALYHCHHVAVRGAHCKPLLAFGLIESFQTVHQNHQQTNKITLSYCELQVKGTEYGIDDQFLP